MINQAKNNQLDYFKDLIKQTNHNCYQSVKNTINTSQKKLNQAIKKGILQISENPQKLELSLKPLSQQQLLKQKKEKLQFQLDNLPQQQGITSQKYKQLKRQLYQIKKQQIDLIKQQQQKLKKQNIQKAKKWRQDQKNIQIRKRKAQQKQKLKQQEYTQRNKKDDEDLKNFSKLERQKIIQKRIKEIEQRQIQRKKILKQSKAYLESHSMPKYLQIQKKYQQQQYQKNFELQIAKKNRKIQMKLDAEALKAHERQFMQKVKNRQAQLSKSRRKSQQSSTQKQQKFNILYNRNQQKLKEELQKLKRRRKFQQKIKQIPIQIDQTKKTQVQIAKDRSKNPFKYNFLSQKALNQFQIYGQFQEFSMNCNGRQLGKEYLKSLKDIPKNQGISKSSSLHSIQKTVHQKPMYKDYLQDLKSQRKFQSQDQFQSAIHTNKNKQHIRDILSKKSEDYEAQALRKLNQMKKSQNYKQTFKKSIQHDKDYMKALKAKIACLEVDS